ncbi:hypothetical protein ACFL41_00115 [Gemmatimonadota bacterium]
METKQNCRCQEKHEDELNQVIDDMGSFIEAFFTTVDKDEEIRSRHIKECSAPKKGRLVYIPASRCFQCEECSFHINFPSPPLYNALLKQIHFAETMMYQDTSDPGLVGPQQVIRRLGRVISSALIGIPAIYDFSILASEDIDSAKFLPPDQHGNGEMEPQEILKPEPLWEPIWNNLTGFSSTSDQASDSVQEGVDIVLQCIEDRPQHDNMATIEVEDDLLELINHQIFGRDSHQTFRQYEGSTSENERQELKMKFARCLSSPEVETNRNLIYRLPLSGFHFLRGAHGTSIKLVNFEQPTFDHFRIRMIWADVCSHEEHRYSKELTNSLVELLESDHVKRLARPITYCSNNASFTTGKNRECGESGINRRCLSYEYDSHSDHAPLISDGKEGVRLIQQGEHINGGIRPEALNDALERAYEWLYEREPTLHQHQIWLMRLVKTGAQSGFTFVIPRETHQTVRRLKASILKHYKEIYKSTGQMETTIVNEKMQTLKKSAPYTVLQLFKEYRDDQGEDRLFGDEGGLLAEMKKTQLPTWATSVFGDPRGLSYAQEDPGNNPRVEIERFLYADLFQDYYSFPIFISGTLWGCLVIVDRKWEDKEIREDNSQKYIIAGLTAADNLGRDIYNAIRRDVLDRIVGEMAQLEVDQWDKYRNYIQKEAVGALPSVARLWIKKKEEKAPTNIEADVITRYPTGGKDSSIAEYILWSENHRCQHVISSREIYFMHLLLKIAVSGDEMGNAIEKVRQLSGVQHLIGVEPDVRQLIKEIDQFKLRAIRLSRKITPADSGLLVYDEDILRLFRTNGHFTVSFSFPDVVIPDRFSTLTRSGINEQDKLHLLIELLDSSLDDIKGDQWFSRLKEEIERTQKQSLRFNISSILEMSDLRKDFGRAEALIRLCRQLFDKHNDWKRRELQGVTHWHSDYVLNIIPGHWRVGEAFKTSHRPHDLIEDEWESYIPLLYLLGLSRGIHLLKSIAVYYFDKPWSREECNLVFSLLKLVFLRAHRPGSKSLSSIVYTTQILAIMFEAGVPIKFCDIEFQGGAFEIESFLSCLRISGMINTVELEKSERWQLCTSGIQFLQALDQLIQIELNPEPDYKGMAQIERIEIDTISSRPDSNQLHIRIHCIGDFNPSNLHIDETRDIHEEGLKHGMTEVYQQLEKALNYPGAERSGIWVEREKRHMGASNQTHPSSIEFHSTEIHILVNRCE